MKYFSMFFAIAALLCICGCSSLTLPNGKYTTNLPGREDFAVIYGDRIHFWLRNPKAENGTGGYFEWAGKFKIADDKRLRFDMDRPTARFMNFYFDVKMNGNNISVEDLMAEQIYLLQYHPAQKRRSRQYDNGQQQEGNTEVYR